jgi:hypothetical protein
VLDLLQAHCRDHVAELQEEFQSGQPFRYLAIDNFLELEFCGQLIREFPAFDPNRARNELGEVGRKAVFTELTRLGAAYARLDGLLRSEEFLAWTGQITGIANLLYDPQYVGGGTHENLDGQDLDPHVDFNYHPASGLHRRLNLIIYLNPEWEECWGGSLELHRNPWLPPEENLVRAIVPLANRAVLFETTEHSWHGFPRITLPGDKKHLSRRSVAVYYYSKDRPAKETAPSHGTVYVPRPLPQHVREGYTLTAADLHEIELLMARRDRQIQYLYEREREYSEVLAGIMRSPAFRLGRVLSWPVRMLRGRGRK